MAPKHIVQNRNPEPDEQKFVIPINIQHQLGYAPLRG
jgi:hypothetical protein